MGIPEKNPDKRTVFAVVWISYDKHRGIVVDKCITWLHNPKIHSTLDWGETFNILANQGWTGYHRIN